MKIHDMPQGSPAWFLTKRGKVGSSSMDMVITPAKEAYSTQAKKLIAALLADMMSDDAAFVRRCLASFRSRPMENGTKLEAEAREYYKVIRGCDVVQVGGVESDCGRWWRSPDGLVVRDGEYVCDLEIKVPDPKTHAAYMLDPASLVAEYRCQIHGAFLCHPWPVEIMSYGDGVPPVMVTVTPDAFTEKLRAALERFDTEFKEAQARIVAAGGVLCPV